MKIGLALSGGGIRGIAHAGAMKALEESNIKPDLIAGTSSGSLVAGLYALGYTPYYIYTLFRRYAKELSKLNTSIITKGVEDFIVNKKISVKGLKTGESLEDMYNKMALKNGINNISQIQIPLFIPAVDISNSKKYVFSSVKINNDKYISDITLGEAVRASSSFPLVFCPYEYKGHIFVDGGALDNIPALELKNNGADKVLSINFESDPIDRESNVMDIAMKVIDIMGNKVSEESLNASDYIITIPSDGTGLLETTKIDYCYKSGYDTVMKNIDKIKISLYN